VSPPVMGTPTVRYGEAPDPSILEPASPERVIAGLIGGVGIAQLREMLGPEVTVVDFDLPHFHGPNECLHLMSLISPLDVDLAVAYLPMPILFNEDDIGFEVHHNLQQGVAMVSCMCGVFSANQDNIGCQAVLASCAEGSA